MIITRKSFNEQDYQEYLEDIYSNINILDESLTNYTIESIPITENDRLNRYIVDESYLRDYDDPESILYTIAETNSIPLDSLYVSIDEGYALLDPSIVYNYPNYVIKPASFLSEDYIYCDLILNEYANTLDEEVLDLLLLPLQEKAVDVKTRTEIINQKVRDPQRREQILSLYRQIDSIKANMQANPNGNHEVSNNMIRQFKKQAKTLIKQDQDDYNKGAYRNQPAPTYNTNTKTGRRSQYVADMLETGRRKRQELATDQRVDAQLAKEEEQSKQPKTKWQKVKDFANKHKKNAGMVGLGIGTGAAIGLVAKRLGALNALKRKYQTLMGKQPQKRNIFMRLIEKIQNAINRLRNKQR